MSKLVCKSCESEKVITVDRSYTKSWKYEIKRNLPGAVYIEKSSISISIHKYACMECGNVFEHISKDDLEKYKELKPYFI